MCIFFSSYGDVYFYHLFISIPEKSSFVIDLLYYSFLFFRFWKKKKKKSDIHHSIEHKLFSTYQKVCSKLWHHGSTMNEIYWFRVLVSHFYLSIYETIYVITSTLSLWLRAKTGRNIHFVLFLVFFLFFDYQQWQPTMKWNAYIFRKWF